MRERLGLEREISDLGIALVPAHQGVFLDSASEMEVSQLRKFIPVEELERKYPFSDQSLSKFRSLVYMAQIGRALARKKEFVDNLQKLVTVENVEIHPGAAKPLQELLNAARLEIGRQGRQIEVKAGNAYRSADWQLKTWATERFPQYYRQATTETTDKKTGKKTPPLIAPGDFSESAVKKLSAYIGARFAAPGFSNHQHGLAVDFHTTETFGRKPKTIKASFDHRDLWWKSWLWNWLEKGKNAYRFGFVPYKKEPWHWEYRPEKAKVAMDNGRGTGSEQQSAERHLVRTQPTSASGQVAIRFTSSVIPRYRDKDNNLRSTDCSIRVPSMLRGLAEIDLLVFFHGLDACSPRHNFDPDKVISNFQLADQIDKAKRKVALAVPVVHWKAHKKGEKKNTNGIWSAANLNSFVEEVLDKIGKDNTRPSLGRLIIAGHSRAYEVMTPLANEFEKGVAETRRGALAQLGEVWALDSTYGSGHAEALRQWARKAKNAQFSVRLYKKETIGKGPRLSHTPLWHWNRSSMEKTTPQNVHVAKVDESHCEIPKKYIQLLLSDRP
ncbi:MAG: hypothetical protein CV087_07170 [Candidatus Brocadia sp. WS118]|nr:MAG: hypothetical protein CV087_07170 [Candidatus Brocadia sp. WS118]